MTPVLIAILACEISFWVVLGAALVCRYLLRLRVLSRVLLLCVPVLDVVLLVLITWDLVAHGSTADFSHGLGAVYLGFTVAFGHRLIASVDAWFAHRFAGGPVPRRVPKHGRERLVHEWKDWGRMAACAAIATAVIVVISGIVGDAERTAELGAWVGRVWLVAGVWLLGWPVWETVRHLTRPAGETGAGTNASAPPASGDGLISQRGR